MASLEGLCSMESLLYEKLAASQEGETLLVCQLCVWVYYCDRWCLKNVVCQYDGTEIL